MSKTPKEFDKGTLTFRPRARLLYLLGHELISDEAIAVTELVKNGYDADAEEVRVTLTNVTKKAIGIIEIRDTGHGMTQQIVKQAWMEPARDNKKGADGQRSRTKRFNRLPLGEKGIGRFSADKLGLRLEIISRFCEFDPKTKKAINLSPEEVVLVIEGKKFLEDAYLDEIECQWLTRNPKEFPRDEHGTLLRISGLRVDWSRELVEKVRNTLARLSSPVDEAKDFNVIFKSTDFQDLSSKIENPLLSIAPFFLDAQINTDGVMTYKIRGPDKKEPEEGEIDLRIGNDHFFISNQDGSGYRKPVCGPFGFKLYAFERDRAKAKKYGMDKPKLDLLNLLCGVSIYRDSFRVAPYGEHGNDWLNFDRRRVLNPGKVLGNDRVIGFVEISQSLNPVLRDKTNREGLIEEGNAFADLRELTMVAADFLGLYRYDSEPHEKRKVRKIEEGKNAINEGKQSIDEISSRVVTALACARTSLMENNFEEAKKAIDSAEAEVQRNKEASKQIEEGGKTLLEELQLSSDQITYLVSLAGIGMTAERMTHEFSHALKHAVNSLQNGLGILNRDRNHDPEINKNITLAINYLMAAKDQVKQMEPLYYSRRKETETLNVAEIARSMEILYSNTIKELELKLEIIGDPDLEVDMGRGHLMQVFDNLFDNAFFWLKYKPNTERPKICIKTSRKDKTVIFADNGPGIDEHVKDHLFEPFVSTKPNGRGLGLFIISDILQNYKAEIDIMTEGSILKGANFIIKFAGD